MCYIYIAVELSPALPVYLKVGFYTMVKIVGKEHLAYKSKKTGRDVDGYAVYVTFEKRNCVGLACDRIFVGRDVFENYFDLPLGTCVEVFYNQYGTALGCTVQKGDA